MAPLATAGSTDEQFASPVKDVPPVSSTPSAKSGISSLQSTPSSAHIEPKRPLEVSQKPGSTTPTTTELFRPSTSSPSLLTKFSRFKLDPIWGEPDIRVRSSDWQEFPFHKLHLASQSIKLKTLIEEAKWTDQPDMIRVGESATVLNDLARWLYPISIKRERILLLGCSALVDMLYAADRLGMARAVGDLKTLFLSQ